LASLKSLKKESDPDPLVRGTDPGIQIRIRTKLSRILNACFDLIYDWIKGAFNLRYVCLPKAIPVFSTADLSFCVFGLGNSVYEENFNTVAKDVDRNLHRLSANRLDSKPVLGNL
jgi:hypothetical protein